MVLEISRGEACRYLVGQTGLAAMTLPPGQTGVRQLLRALRCIQLDPLDRVGTNADLVALARVDGIRRGDVYRYLLPGHAFEHWAKERCLLPRGAFPYYRKQARETPWWHTHIRLKRLPTGLIDEVLAAVESGGPLAPADLDHGRVTPLDWSGWKGTSRASAMALEVLWSRCQVVVVGRTARGKLYDVPSRVFPDHHDKAAGDFARWALLQRVEAAGLLSTATGPQWGLIGEARKSGLQAQLIAEGELAEVRIEGSRRSYLVPADFRDRAFPELDQRMRVLGPLDPLLWDRKLVKHAFGFEYIWEVYKPAAKRRWGYYVCPLLHRGKLVGRFEGHRDEGRLVIDSLWREPGQAFDERAWEQARNRLEAAQ